MTMVTVEFKSIGPGKCRWCKKDKDEVLELAFSDGSFVGRYCFADFKKALQDKLEDGTTQPAQAVRKQPAAGNGEVPQAAPVK
jgi:hypothetical protein